MNYFDDFTEIELKFILSILTEKVSLFENSIDTLDNLIVDIKESLEGRHV